jgi:hypothetical protein
MSRPYKREIKAMLRRSRKREQDAREDALAFYMALRKVGAALRSAHGGRCTCDECRIARCALRSEGIGQMLLDLKGPPCASS